MSDPYEELGEFHDLFMEGAWARLRPALVQVFSGLTSADLIVDLGAGTGVGTRILAGCTPAQIVAIEPSRTMRAVLLARIADDSALADRVSVIAGAAPEALDEVAGPVAGFVCAHMIGHVPADSRRSIFGTLAALLTDAGRGIVTVDRDDAPDDRGEVVEERRIGRHRYLARHLPAETDGEYASEYAVLAGDRVVRQARFGGSWQPVTFADLTSELDPAGLTAALVMPGVAQVTAARLRP